ncbi:hypothetical protein RND81_09G160000 [Saponaria officinalis]|uniref:Xylanase inhibitor C-terminal domain-containing protein n=1 Tax=Saponaria officinalis TaxID=3572 RepID=A0AAW1IN20_SAPOF
MNRDPSSFMGQFGARSRGRFSYCFAPIYNNYQQPQMFLRFGDDIPHHNLKYRTPLIQGPLSRYYLDLKAISVDEAELKINSSVFQLREDGLGGSFINSGSRDTWLIDVAYREFERELIETMIYRYPTMEVSRRSGTLWFIQPERGVRTKFPEVTFLFANNAKFVIKPEAYMSGLKQPMSRHYLLLIFPSDKSTVLGARQQVNHRIIYDIANSELQFEPRNCIHNN